MQPKPVFELPHYQLLNETREAFLKELLPTWIRELDLKSAIDVGCGQGYFSGTLQSLGLDVTACDGRRENIEIAARNHLGVNFRVANAEDPALATLGKFDLTFCFGLLYHLENPFIAIRNLQGLAGKVLMLESVCIPGDRAILDLRDEGKTEDQGLNFVAFYPTEACLVKMLHCSGFPHVYRFRRMPDHEDFREGRTQGRVRTIMTASRAPLNFSILVEASDPPQVVNPWATGWGKVRGSAHVLRNALRPVKEKTD